MQPEKKKQILDALFIVGGIVGIMVPIAGLMGAMALPSLLVRIYTPEANGHAGALLLVTYWSNLGLAVYCGLMLLWVLGFAVIWGHFALKRFGKLGFMTIRNLILLSILIVVMPGGLAFLMLRDEKVFSIIDRYQADLALFWDKKTETYEGRVIPNGWSSVPGPHYDGRPRGYLNLKTEKATFALQCPVGLADGVGGKKDSRYRITYLPNTRTVVSVEAIPPATGTPQKKT